MKVSKLMLSTGSEYYDRAYKLLDHGLILIRSKADALKSNGTTALMLEIAQQYTQLGRDVIWLEPKYSAFPHRLHGIDKTKFHVLTATTSEEIRMAVKGFKQYSEKPVYMLDGLRHFEDINYDYAKFALNITLADPSATVVVSRQNAFSHDTCWDEIIDVHYVKPDNDDRTKLGHLGELRGWVADREIGTVSIYINYGTGRFSPAWEQVQQELEVGVSPSSTFTSPDGTVSVRGCMSYVHEMNRRLLNG